MGKFDLSAACPGKAKKQKKMPKAHDVIIGPSWSLPPSAVASKLGRGGDWLIGVDLETNDWEKIFGIKGTFGQFGHIGANGTTTPASQQKAYEYVC